MIERRISIAGTGKALPLQCVSSLDLDKKYTLSEGLIEKLTGVKQRYIASAEENAATIAAEACRNALRNANISLSDIDCVVAACGTMDQGLPNNAALIHRELEIGNDLDIPAIDVNMSCLSFLGALDMISWPLSAGKYQNILIVSSDVASCGLNWKNPDVSGIFGDGAAAAVVTRSEDTSTGKILASSVMTHSSGVDLCQIEGGGSRIHPSRTGEYNPSRFLFQMDGKKAYKLVAHLLPNFIQKLLDQAHLTLSDIDVVVPHQGSAHGLRHLTKLLSLPSEKVINIFAEHGNQVAASLPTALHTALYSHKLKRGSKIMLIGFGAGISVGGMIVEY